MGAFKRCFKGILKKILSPTGVLYDAPPPSPTPLVPCLSGEIYFSLPENGFNAWELKGFSHLWKLRLEDFLYVMDVWKVVCTFMFSLDHLGKRDFLISFQFPKIFPCQTDFSTNHNNNRSSREFIFPPLIISSFCHFFKNIKQLIKCMNLTCQGKTSFCVFHYCPITVMTKNNNMYLSPAFAARKVYYLIHDRIDKKRLKVATKDNGIKWHESITLV